MKLNPTTPDPITQLAGQIVQPNTTPEGHNTLPKSVRPNAQWRYKAHPARWDWIEEYGWHPVLGRWHLDNGLDGVTINKKGYSGLGVARQRHLERGWIIIELGDSRLGEFAQYLQSFPTVKGYPHYISIFHTPEVEGKFVEWLFDKERYGRFLEQVVSSGVVPPMREMIRRGKMRTQDRIVEKLERDMFESPNNPMIRVRYEREARKLAGMRGEDIDQARNEARVMAQAAVEKGQEDAVKSIDKAEEMASILHPTMTPTASREPITTDDGKVQCPGCGKEFDTVSQFSGHKAHCDALKKGSS